MGANWLCLVLLVAGAAVVLVVRRHADRAWLREWAASQGYGVVDARRLTWGGLGVGVRAALARWPLPTTSAMFRVIVTDRRGDQRSGSVLLVRGVLWLRDHVDVAWDEADLARRAQQAMRRYREMRSREHDDGR